MNEAEISRGIISAYTHIGFSLLGDLREEDAMSGYRMNGSRIAQKHIHVLSMNVHL